VSDNERADIQALENFQASAVTRNSNAGYRLPGQAKATGALWVASQAAFQLDSSDQPFHEVNRSPRTVAAVVLEVHGLSRLPQAAPSSD